MFAESTCSCAENATDIATPSHLRNCVSPSLLYQNYKRDIASFYAQQHICYNAYMLSSVRPSVCHTGVL